MIIIKNKDYFTVHNLVETLNLIHITDDSKRNGGIKSVLDI